MDYLPEGMELALWMADGDPAETSIEDCELATKVVAYYRMVNDGGCPACRGVYNPDLGPCGVCRDDETLESHHQNALNDLYTHAYLAHHCIPQTAMQWYIKLPPSMREWDEFSAVRNFVRTGVSAKTLWHDPMTGKQIVITTPATVEFPRLPLVMQVADVWDLEPDPKRRIYFRFGGKSFRVTGTAKFYQGRHIMHTFEYETWDGGRAWFPRVLNGYLYNVAVDYEH